MNTQAHHQLDKETKVALMMQVMYSLGKDVLLDRKLFNQINDRLMIIAPKVSKEALAEQTGWGIVAIKKYQASLDEAHQLICDLKTIDFCFEKFVADGGLDGIFNPMDPSITKH